MMISMEAKIEKTIFRTMSILLAVKNIHTLSKTTEYLKKENGLLVLLRITKKNFSRNSETMSKKRTDCFFLSRKKTNSDSDSDSD